MWSMTREIDQCGGETSGVDMGGNLNLAVLLPRGCLAGQRCLRYWADGPRSGRLTSKILQWYLSSV